MAGDPKCGHQVRFASGAATGLVFADLQLDVIWALATSLMLAAFLVQLVGLVMVALELDEAFEAHLDGLRPCICSELSATES